MASHVWTLVNALVGTRTHQHKLRVMPSASASEVLYMYICYVHALKAIM